MTWLLSVETFNSRVVLLCQAYFLALRYNTVKVHSRRTFNSDILSLRLWLPPDVNAVVLASRSLSKLPAWWPAQKGVPVDTWTQRLWPDILIAHVLLSRQVVFITPLQCQECQADSQCLLKQFAICRHHAGTVQSFVNRCCLLVILRHTVGLTCKHVLIAV